MKFRESLYIGDYIEAKKTEIIEKLKQKKISPTVYVILICEGRLEIVYNYLLFARPYADKDFTIVGISSGKFEAFRLVERIAKDAIKLGMEMNLVGFLNEQAKLGGNILEYEAEITGREET